MRKSANRFPHICKKIPVYFYKDSRMFLWRLACVSVMRSVVGAGANLTVEFVDLL